MKQQKHDKIVELQRLINEGLESGVSRRSMDEVLRVARNKAIAALRAQK